MRTVDRTVNRKGETDLEIAADEQEVDFEALFTLGTADGGVDGIKLSVTTAFDCNLAGRGASVMDSG